jgi:hypothetical protein
LVAPNEYSPEEKLSTFLRVRLHAATFSVGLGAFALYQITLRSELVPSGAIETAGAAEEQRRHERLFETYTRYHETVSRID